MSLVTRMPLIEPLILQLHNRMIIVAVSKIIAIDKVVKMAIAAKVTLSLLSPGGGGGDGGSSPTSEITINATAQKVIAAYYSYILYNYQLAITTETLLLSRLFTKQFRHHTVTI